MSVPHLWAPTAAHGSWRGYSDRVSGLPIEAKFTSSPDRPVSEADRDELTGRLNLAYTAGDLDFDHYRELMDGVYQASHRGELVPVAQELPARYRSTAPQGATADVPLAPGEVNQPQLSGRPAPGRLLAIVAGGVGLVLVIAVVLLVVL